MADLIQRGQRTWLCWAGPEFVPYVTAALVAEWAANVQNSARTTLVARDGREVVGFISLLPESDSYLPSRTDPASAHMSQLFVAPERHGSGVAQDLERTGAQATTARSFESVRLWCPEPNGRARSFYEKSGFAPTGGTTTFAGLRRVEYRRPLRP